MADTKIPGNSIILGFFDDFYLRYPNASPKQRTVKSFGYLEDQTDLEAFWKEVNACNDSLKHKRDLRIEIPVSEMMYSENNRLLNYGYKFPESVYHLLGIDTFFEQYQRSSGFRGKYSLNEIFRYLVMDRILYPASKREAASRLLNYYGLNSEFDLPDIYRALDQFNIIFYDLQRFISEQVGERFGRDLQYSFYDVTNYYTEKDFADPDEEYRDRSGKLVSGPALGQKGVSKEHQLTPIIQMGLFMDGNGVPICMDVFRGNMSDSDTLKENLDGFKKEYSHPRKTVIENGQEAVYKEKELEEMDVVFLMDRFGYAKTIDLSTYERNKEAADAENKYVFTCKNTGRICLFTNTGQMHTVKVLDLPYGKFRDKGVPIDNVSNFSQAKEELVYITSQKELNLCQVIFATAESMLKVVDGGEFDVTKRTVAATKLAEGDTLVSVTALTDQRNIVLQTKGGFFLRFAVDEIPEKKKGAIGVRGMKLSDGDLVENVYYTKNAVETTIEYKGKELVLNNLKLGKRDSKGTKVRV